jgi:hypothetical protein
MKRVSSFTENRIYELWFDGIPRDTIAEVAGLSGSTVSGVISNLPENLKDLRKTSVELRKLRLSVSEAKRGVELLAELTELGVGSDQLQESIEALEKTCKEATYEPKEVVEAAIRLAALEAESCKSYTEILQEFQTKKNSLERLEKREQELKQEVVEREREREQALARSKVTEKQIGYITMLRQSLRQHGIALENVADLRKYLENMQETGGDPTAFVRYTEEQGSLRRILLQLRGEYQLAAANLQHLQQETVHAKTTRDALQVEISSLQKDRGEEQTELSTLSENNRQLQQKYQEGLATVAQLLKVEATAKGINEGLALRATEMRKLDTEIAQRRQTIASLESEKVFLEKENGEKRERLALADTVTKFLAAIPEYNFDRFHYHVETIKRLREEGTHAPGLALPLIEEEARSEALKVFEGDLVSKRQHKELMEKYESCERARSELEKKVQEHEAKYEETKRDLEYTSRQRQLLETLRINFEGRSTTLAELRNWALSVFQEEIERKADEKFNALAAATYGGIEFIGRKIASMFSNHRSGQQ